MARILLLGYVPELVDYSDPALPPGMNAERVHAGIAVAMKQFAEHGWDADLLPIRPDDTAAPAVERQLASIPYDCVVIGGGVRLGPVAWRYSKRSSTPCTGGAGCGDRLQHAARRQRRCCRQGVGASDQRRIGGGRVQPPIVRTAPTVISVTPRPSLQPTASPRNSAARTMVSGRLSLSIGLTRDAGASCRARK